MSLSRSSLIAQCVRVAKPSDLEFLLGEMVRPGAMADMIDDSYANYVVQTALDFAQGEERTELVKEIMPLLSSIKSRSWYKRILTKLGLAVNHNNNYYDSTRHSLSRLVDDSIHSRMTSEHRGLGPMHGYSPIHGPDRSLDHRVPPSGFIHGPPGGGPPSDRNGYRVQQHPVSTHAQLPPQYANFYPYGRSVVHHSDYRSNADY